MSNFIANALNLIDEVKEKITSEEYKIIVDELKKANDDKPEYYRVKYLVIESCVPSKNDRKIHTTHKMCQSIIEIVDDPHKGPTDISMFAKLGKGYVRDIKSIIKDEGAATYQDRHDEFDGSGEYLRYTRVVSIISLKKIR